jgi:hypothetical protein
MNKKREGSSDVEDVRREEMSRGRRPVSLETRRQRQELLHDLRKLLEIGTEDDFVAAMRALGFGTDSPQWDEMIRIWREYRP